ncbi:hypothetical protein [Heyndrickxia oleronia]|uniref:DUF2157 domain-containing protein n=1 Tax=Heyndrickxia oleronia TaxID=38875 RepID=A0AAW6SS71_9BACI|nr:hypothetical protein [Heyndrickxia oleronia]MDH5160155.1 hypothetical protein [Heyndrickxia oleronia]
MNSSRKEVIIKEIIYWKEHKMLPDHYCDYLLALYSEGEFENNHNDRMKSNKLVNRLSLFLILIGALLLISLFVIYFTELAFVLQMMILTSFVVLLLILGIYYSKKETWYYIFYISSAILLLLLSVQLTDKFFYHYSIALLITLFLNCILWVATGWKLKLLFFTVSGVVGIITLTIYILV